MTSKLLSRFFRDFVIVIFAAAMVLVTSYGILLLAESFRDNGSTEGNSLLFTIGIVLFFPSIVAFIFAIVYWKSSRHSAKDKGG